MKGVFVVTQLNPNIIVTRDILPITARQVKSTSFKSRAPHIAVTNPSHFKVAVGSKVTIGFSLGFEWFTGVTALLLPIVNCAIGVLFAPAVFLRVGIHLTNFLRFIIAAVLFILTAAIVKRLERRTYSVITPTITSVI